VGLWVRSPLGHPVVADLPHLTYQCSSALCHALQRLVERFCATQFGVIAVRAGVIAPVVPPLLPARDRAAAPSVATLVREPLPLPTLSPRRTSTVFYGLSAVDDRGRVADRVVMRALGWSGGAPPRHSRRDGAGSNVASPSHDASATAWRE
jgi:hypothetical protein